MKIGDKVRVISGSEEGRIIDFKGHNLVEIEIEDGFSIPVMKDDLVVVAEEESTFFEGKSSPTPVSQKQDKGQSPIKSSSIPHDFYLAYIPTNENDITVYICNNSSEKILFNISEKEIGKIKSISHGSLEAGKSTFVTYLKLDKFERWPELFLQIIPVYTSLSPISSSKEFSIKPKAKSFFTSKSKIPGFDKEGFIIGIKKGAKIEAKKIQESLMEQNTAEDKELKRQPSGGDVTIDLHIEAIREDYLSIKKEEMLDLQIQQFEIEMDQAIRKGVNSIKFIHGIGNGSLRLAIHKKLSQLDHIRYFEDADKGKFGYGATTVFL